MWTRRSHTLAPLTGLKYIKHKFKWTQVKQDDLGESNQIVACDTLLTYPYFNETLKIHANANAFQLGAVISQKVKPISFYSRKFTYFQQPDKVTEL